MSLSRRAANKRALFSFSMVFTKLLAIAHITWRNNHFSLNVKRLPSFFLRRRSPHKKIAKNIHSSI